MVGDPLILSGSVSAVAPWRIISPIISENVRMASALAVPRHSPREHADGRVLSDHPLLSQARDVCRRKTKLSQQLIGVLSKLWCAPSDGARGVIEAMWDAGHSHSSRPRVVELLDH